MNTNYTPQIPTNDSRWSFEEYLLSRFEVCYPERKLLCILCKKVTTTSYRIEEETIDCHGVCLSLAFFHYFMEDYDVAAMAKKSRVSGMLHLLKLCELTLQFLKMPERSHRCIFCGGRGAFFKCASENCGHYYHLSCNTNGMVVVESENDDTKITNYRFMLCQTHMNNTDVEQTKQLFKSKMALLTENETVKRPIGMSMKMPPSSDAMTPLSSSSSSIADTPKHATRGQWNSKLLRGDRKQMTSRGLAGGIRKLDEYLLPTNSLRSTRIGRPAAPKDKGIARDYISALLHEYGMLRRYGYQRNAKVFEWRPYEVLFTKFGVDLFSDNSPTQEELEELYKDLRSVLVFDNSVDSAADLNRLALECEPSIMNISNSMVLQLKQGIQTAELSGNQNDEHVPATYAITQPNVYGTEFDVHNTSATTEYEKESYGKVNLASQASTECESQRDIYEIVGYKTHRPVFILAKFENRAAWFSVIYLKSKKHGGVKQMILDYINIGMLEYEYLKRVMRSTYALPSQSRVVPIFSQPEETEIDEPAPEADKVNLGGFCWDVEPTAEGYLKNRLVTPLKHYHEAVSANDKMSLGAMIKVEDVEANMLYNPVAQPKKMTFVSKQANVLVGMLRAVNKAIEEQKQVLKERLALENDYGNRMHEDVLLVEQYKKLTGQMNRWSHFRQTVINAVNLFNKLLLYEAGKEQDDAKTGESVAETVKETADKEFCSVCLMSEPAHKQVMHQCNRCYIRVHYKCYVTYKQATSEQVAVDLKVDGTSTEWYCDPCEYEILMNANSRIIMYNNAICCACFSSGGALKRVLESPSKKQIPLMPVKWIHVHCAALLMPTISCQDVFGLTKWELRNLQFNGADRCVICMVTGGATVECAEPNCQAKFHTTCAWVGGAYVVESPFHNTTELPAMGKSVLAHNELFPSLAFRMFCLRHTASRFSEKAVTILMRRRCFAYTHYLHCPWYPTRDAHDSRSVVLPLRPCTSHIEVTRNGTIQGLLGDMGRRKEGVDVLTDHMSFEKHAKQKRMPMLKPNPDLMSSHPPGMMMNQQFPGMPMMNPAHGGIVHYPHGMVINGTQPMIINGQPMLPAPGHPLMVAPGRPMIIAGGPPMLVSAHPRGLVNVRRHIVPSGMPKPVMAPIMYGAQPQFMVEQPQFGVATMTSHIPGNGFLQSVGQPRMNSIKMPAQPTMMPYVQPMNVMPMSGPVMPVAQQPQFHQGYPQPVQMVPKYWNNKSNLMQYKGKPPCPDNPYVGAGNMGYMEQ
ncbi:uncharacterized protein BXIN_2972 [Babesia sp. Xinjiang]|uniref:uncharacterized protein n=1 Tax=Babesia sp. Xinjiang TaxID=462227 RepID=UPI000A25F519|nr:uncharacterized protein BXIN_2972 [Babesia sp. Xinjiang]ORM39448.1 hypothetical protein BXIN_2972 [Babesia sp. Xinjiang]